MYYLKISLSCLICQLLLAITGMRISNINDSLLSSSDISTLEIISCCSTICSCYGFALTLLSGLASKTDCVTDIFNCCLSLEMCILWPTLALWCPFCESTVLSHVNLWFGLLCTFKVVYWNIYILYEIRFKRYVLEWIYINTVINSCLQREILK